MKQFIEQLEKELTEKLNIVWANSKEMSAAYRSQKAVTEALSRMSEYVQQNTHKDDNLFLRNGSEFIMHYEVGYVKGTDFCIGTYLVARLQTHNQLRVCLQEELDLLTRPSVSPPLPGIASKLKWTRNLTDPVELIYGLYLTECFNNGQSKFREIVAWIEFNMDVDLGKIYNSWQEIKERKKIPAKFFGEMTIALEKKKNEIG